MSLSNSSGFGISVTIQAQCLRTSWSALVGISEHRWNWANARTLDEVQIVVRLIKRGLLEFLTCPFRIAGQHQSLCTKLGLGVVYQCIHGDKPITINWNTASSRVSACEYQRTTIHE